MAVVRALRSAPANPGAAAMPCHMMGTPIMTEMACPVRIASARAGSNVRSRTSVPPTP